MYNEFCTSDSKQIDNCQQQQFSVVEKKPDHHYRTEIPNIIFTIGLDPYELTLYTILKKVAGDYGACWQTIKTLATACNMSERKVQECLKKFSGPMIGQTPLITLERRKNADGSYSSNVIHIVDIWRMNGDFFRGGGGAHGAPGGGAPCAPGGAPGAVKEEPIKQDLKQQQQEPPAAAVFFDCLKELQIPEHEKTWIMQRYANREKDVILAIAWATSPNTNIATTLEQAIKWHLKCDTKPTVEPSEEERIHSHRKFSNDLEAKIHSPTAKYLALNNHSEIITTTTTLCFDYHDKDFLQKQAKALTKYGFVKK